MRWRSSMASKAMSGAASVRTMMMLVSSTGMKPFLTTPNAQTVATMVPTVTISMRPRHPQRGVERDAIGARHQVVGRLEGARQQWPGRASPA